MIIQAMVQPSTFSPRARQTAVPGAKETMGGVGGVELGEDNRLIATIVNNDGSPAWKLEIDRRTGVMRGIP